MIGYIASVLIGISLGLIGGGGSILTVPVLVYIFGIDPLVATTYSLFIVGITSTAGSISYFKNNLIDFEKALYFGIPSIISVYITRKLILPIIPDHIANVGNIAITKGGLMMILFAILMLFSAYSMIRKRPEPDTTNNQNTNYIQLIGLGLLVGIMTGLVGAGGGFLIIPALVNLLKLPMKKAIGTSLLIISMNSLLGFLFSMSDLQIDWPFILSIAGIAIIGILIGAYLANKIDGKKLKPAFGWFVLVMGIYILIKETYLK